MIPNTINNMPAMLVLSAMQKFIRRGLEKEAMECAVELIHTSKPYTTMVCNRLEVICHEDIDVLSRPELPGFVRASVAQALERRKSDEKLGECRLMVGNVIRALARAPKSREGCHFAASVGLRAMFEDGKPEIPDYAYDMHTREGKRRGRGLEHFLAEGAQLVPPQKGRDKYKAEATRLWEYKYNKT